VTSSKDSGDKRKTATKTEKGEKLRFQGVENLNA